MSKFDRQREARRDGMLYRHEYYAISVMLDITDYDCDCICDKKAQTPFDGSGSGRYIPAEWRYVCFERGKSSSKIADHEAEIIFSVPLKDMGRW